MSAQRVTRERIARVLEGLLRLTDHCPCRLHPALAVPHPPDCPKYAKEFDGCHRCQCERPGVAPPHP